MNEINKILDISSNYYHYLMTFPNVKGVGVGIKTINGQLTNEPCIHVLVEKKVNSKCLSQKDRVPKYYMGIKTDVINTGKIIGFTSNPITNRFRPLQGGGSIMAENGEGDGTLGCIVQRGFLKKEYFILSNNHVISEFSKVPIMSPIIQPSVTYGGTLKDSIAYLSETVPIKFKKGFKSPINYIDCAIAQITNRGLLSKLIFKIGSVKGINKAILKEEVKKTGFMTGLTKGIVRTIGATREIEFTPNKVALFKEQILTDIKSAPGDSGSVILNKNNEIIGLLMGGSEEMGVTIANDINTVLKQLNVSIYK